ncbi:HipA N-terminal domain-containing protein [Roseateles sp. YR242]|uniref:HipA N-terminal domain-containing protein n=1 Tax=Roseateles sp. YR242 TaxID=1855305 RepID=UPI0008BD9A55|nr:HipA N-terminal domain-containing protein [Roseateles sp. YR242]SEK31981.1 HipA N-terminal domain-containing protein [Roseateles sp. YR242]
MAEQLSSSGAQLRVTAPEGESGFLRRDGNYLFTFSPQAIPSVAPSLTMPLRARPYESAQLHPIFHMNLPEGFVLEQLRNRLAKSSGMDPLLLLSVLGSQAPIGRLRFAVDGQGVRPQTNARQGERLADLLAARGSRELSSRQELFNWPS